MSLNDLRSEFSSEISQIADELNNSLPMSKPRLRSAFSDDELKELHALVYAVNQTTKEKEKIAKIASHAKSAYGLLKKLGVGL